MKQLYFKAVPQYGDLWMEQVLVEYVYPILFVLVDGNSERYLCLCYNTVGRQEWVVAPSSKQGIIALLKNQISIRDSLTNGAPQVILVERCYETGTESSRAGRIADLPDGALPEAGEYMDAEPAEWDAYISRLERENEASITSSFVLLTERRSCRLKLTPKKENVHYICGSDDTLLRRGLCLA